MSHNWIGERSGAFSSEAETGSLEENAIKQELRAPLRFNLIATRSKLLPGRGGRSTILGIAIALIATTSTYGFDRAGARQESVVAQTGASSSEARRDAELQQPGAGAPTSKKDSPAQAFLSRELICLGGITAVIISALLMYAVISRKKQTIRQLNTELAASTAQRATLSRRMLALRRVIERTRLNASRMHEIHLANLAADIHDGPLQLISLILLRLPQASDIPSQTELAADIRITPLIQQALTDLRNLSAGLALPEIQALSLAATLELVISRHEELTGSRVARTLGELPAEVALAIRICCYRIVQEALTNAYKHAAGHAQHVMAVLNGETLQLTISDGGPLATPPQQPALLGGGLGLRGMELRVKALRGTLTIDHAPAGGTRVNVSLPIRSAKRSFALQHRTEKWNRFSD